MKTNTNQAFQKNIYENGKAVLFISHVLHCKRKFILNDKAIQKYLLYGLHYKSL